MKPPSHDEPMKSHRLGRPSTAPLVLLTVALVLAVQGIVQLSTAAPAGAVPGLFRTPAANSANNSNPIKTIDAVCPSETRLVGGGGAVADGNSRQVRLTQLIPNTGGLNDFYRVTAVEPPAGYAENWFVTAYALCAPPLPGLEIVNRPSENSVSNFKHVTRGCSTSSKRVLSVGGDTGQIPQVALNLVRPDGNLTIGRLSGRVDAGGYSSPWFMRLYMICADPIPGLHNEAQVLDASAAGVGCDSGQVHGAGGGGGTVESGAVHLQSVVPSQNLNIVTATMTGTPTGGGMVAQATCAT
jgi:hypothetical protein